MDLKRELAQRAGLSPSELDELSKNAEREYSCYFIRKKDGKKRKICAPSDRLKRVQSLLCSLVFSKFKVSKYSRAYEKGDCLKNNVLPHRKALHVYKADIESFFPSVGYACFYELLKKKYDGQEIEFLWRLCSLGGGLPIGSPASPMISNRIMAAVDKKLAKAARGCVYTRYADDLTFSSKKYIDKRIEKQVDEILRGFGFRVNAKKCKFFSLAKGIRITGLTVSHEHKVTVGSRYKRKLKKLIHNFKTKGEGSKRKLRGKLAFVRSVEKPCEIEVGI